MPRNTAKILSVIGVISAGSAVHANSGDVSEHHDLIVKSPVASGHDSAFLDGNVDRANAGLDHQDLIRNDTPMRGHKEDDRGPLPPEAGAER